jgi:hypothetical protein
MVTEVYDREQNAAVNLNNYRLDLRQPDIKCTQHLSK